MADTSVARGAPMAPALQLSRQCVRLMSATAAEAAGYMLMRVFASEDGLYLVARMHARNMRVHLRYAPYARSRVHSDALSLHKQMVDDVVHSVAGAMPHLTVRAERTLGDAWSLTLAPIDAYAPLTVLVSALPTAVKQALQTVLVRRGFVASGDRATTTVCFGQFEYQDVLVCAFSPGLVLTAVLLYTLSARDHVRREQCRIYRAALCAAIPDVEFRPRRTPTAQRGICERNVRHMQRAAAAFGGELSWAQCGAQALAALRDMADECQNDVRAAKQRRIQSGAL